MWSKKLLLVLIFSLMGCDLLNINSDTPPAQKPDPQIEIIAQECSKDSDCAMVPKRCCSCSSGGTMIAIHKSQKQSYEKELNKQCDKSVICPAWYRCGEQSAKCQNSRCVTIEN